MLTPQEVSERAFSKASFGGYNMAQVDEFLDILTGDYSALYSENAVLKSKMKVLVDKVDEYRSTEEAMRKALMVAKQMADDLVREAEQKKAEILRDAENSAHSRISDLGKEVEAEEFRLRKAQEATAAFVAQVRALYAKEDAYLSQLSSLCPPEAVPPPADPVEEAASEIDDNVQRLLAQAMAGVVAPAPQPPQTQEPAGQPGMEDTAEYAPLPQEGTTPPAGGIDFGPLQFGRDYEIT
ncbi:MAG: DivIVA domain-containing protein [Lawsonibacter sp.]|nr:DivIVA domain-containing protein [Lawsonibacter sp.]